MAERTVSFLLISTSSHGLVWAGEAVFDTFIDALRTLQTIAAGAISCLTSIRCNFIPASQKPTPFPFPREEKSLIVSSQRRRCLICVSQTWPTLLDIEPRGPWPSSRTIFVITTDTQLANAVVKTGEQTGLRRDTDISWRAECLANETLRSWTARIYLMPSFERCLRVTSYVCSLSEITQILDSPNPLVLTYRF